jgi:NADPH:quinone reductase-like Zn-dependent oxidoreductase
VLIHAAAGGVGHYAVQLAKWAGAHIVGTASAQNAEFLRGLGAHEVIDYTAGPFEEGASDMDVVLDTQSGETRARSWETLRKGGVLVSTLPPPPQQEAEAHGARGAFIFVRPNGRQLGEIGELIDSGHMMPHVQTVLPLADARKAHELSEAGHVRGKLVIEIVPS